jgi:hypothetical protein
LFSQQKKPQKNHKNHKKKPPKNKTNLIVHARYRFAVDSLVAAGVASVTEPTATPWLCVEKTISPARTQHVIQAILQQRRTDAVACAFTHMYIP